MKFTEALEEIYQKYKGFDHGTVSQAFPALQRANPTDFTISVATIDGQIFEIGDTDVSFTIQSISKLFTYGLALEQRGESYIEQKIGMEPTGEDYDSIIKFDELHRPFNPMINSGAMVTTSLIQSQPQSTRERTILNYYSRFAGAELSVDEEVFQSECHTSHKNWAIAHLLKHFKCLDDNYVDDLMLYFSQCSVSLTARHLALMGATLANNGVNPETKEKCIDKNILRNVLSVIFTCGMYNYSGEWAFDVGLPAKSGISGAILMIVPGIMSFVVYSPRLDRRGNSMRGIKVCEEISNRFNLHVFGSHRAVLNRF